MTLNIFPLLIYLSFILFFLSLFFYLSFKRTNDSAYFTPAFLPIIAAPWVSQLFAVHLFIVTAPLAAGRDQINNFRALARRLGKSRRAAEVVVVRMRRHRQNRLIFEVEFFHIC